MSFYLRTWMLVAIALVAGCGKTPAPSQLCSFSALMEAADPPPADVIDAVLTSAEPVERREPVPEPPGPGSEYIDSVGQALAGAVDKPPVARPATPTLMLFSATWCGPCQPEKARIADLEAAGENVLLYDFDADEAQFKRWGVEVMPTWIRVNPQGREVGRVPQRGKKEYLHADRDKLLNAHPPVAVGAFGLFEIPPIRVADWIPLIAGGERSFGWGVSVNVPKNLTWTTRKAGQSLFLEFKAGSCPQVSWPMRTVNFQSVEINPAYLEIKTNAWLPVMRTIRLNIDYTPPAAQAPRAAPVDDGKPYA